MNDSNIDSRIQSNRVVRAAVQSIWPAFIGAILCVGIVFSLFDPHYISATPGFFPQSATGIYTITFFLLWLGNCVACLFTWYLAVGGHNQKS